MDACPARIIKRHIFTETEVLIEEKGINL